MKSLVHVTGGIFKGGTPLNSLPLCNKGVVSTPFIDFQANAGGLHTLKTWKKTMFS